MNPFIRLVKASRLSQPDEYSAEKGEPIILYQANGQLIDFSGMGAGLPEGGPGVLIREEEDGDATWAEVELMTNVKGSVVWDGVTGTQPPRPDFQSVDFVQPVDPEAVAEDGDTWTEPET